MKFQGLLKNGKLVKRYKRFFAEVQLSDSSIVTAHVPNTGSLMGCLDPGSPCRLSYVDNPKRKLKYTLHMIKTPTSWVGVNTGLSNDLVWEAFSARSIPHWNGMEFGQREVKISGDSRIDLVLWKNSFSPPSPEQRLSIGDFENQKFHFVEIKNVTLARDRQAQFPDAQTERGRKHLRELMSLLTKGHTAEIFFTVQREDCDLFSPALDIDPEYARLLAQAVDKGLIVTAVPCILHEEGIELNPFRPLKIQISPFMKDKGEIQTPSI